uniref:Si:ch211-215c18.3 n=1 Tax=Myripristis murdjan TaxID=586833 RepID=A0A667Z7T7_9TELE
NIIKVKFSVFFLLIVVSHVLCMYPCLTYLERNVRVDCEFPPTYQLPGPYCEYRQDSRLVGSTYPNVVNLVSTEDRRRANVSLVNPTLCRLTWAPLADEKPYTYSCRVYQGSSWKENSMAVVLLFLGEDRVVCILLFPNKLNFSEF